MGLLLFAGCGSGSDSGSAESASNVSATAPLRTPRPKPTARASKGPEPKRLFAAEIIYGHGPRAELGDTVTVEYLGYEYRTGKEFGDHAWGKGEPATFTLGEDEVIRGWEEGVYGMKPAGRRKVVIPPELAYGPGIPPPEIGPDGPNGTVVFAFEMLGLKKAR